MSTAAVDPNSAAIINFIGASVPLHPDFGAGQYQGSTIGIPYLVVDGTQPGVDISYVLYGSESDPGPMPIPASAPIEGYPNYAGGDQHVLVLDTNTCFLYELDKANPVSGGGWTADSGAVWDLNAGEQRPWGWTSADAAGLPIFPGLVRYDEVAAGKIAHAIRFTLSTSAPAFIPPASHQAGASSNASALPMGARLRLKSTFNISTFSAANQVILTAMQHYGLILADNGGSMFISGAPDDRWDNNDLDKLKNITASSFEVLLESPVYTDNSAPTGNAPTITSFTASTTSVAAGGQVTLSWQVGNAGYLIVSPLAGAVHGSSVVVTPSKTTTFTLYATNQFGRSMATVTVNVH